MMAQGQTSGSPPPKPLGIRAYGHIAHLPGSRMGPGDHRISDGQATICTVKARDRHDTVIVQQKVDGSCVAVANIDGSVIALIRAGYPAVSSHFEQHRLFALWVALDIARFDCLKPGERLCGEWLAQAHGTRYKLPHEPFVAFDLMRGHERATLAEFTERASARQFVLPQLLHAGGPLGVEASLALVNPGYHGALDPVEGCVWRVERKGVVDFLAKWVRPDKIDGCYLPEISGKDPVWNWRPK
jgi:hypothetical protein